jgi:hypothetical protein
MFSAGSSVAGGATVDIGAGAQAPTGSEGFVQQVVGSAMTFGHMTCFGPKGTGGTSDVFTVRKNGASVGTATCTIPTGGTTFITNTITLSVAVGDLIDIQVANGNTAGGATAALAP